MSNYAKINTKIPKSKNEDRKVIKSTKKIHNETSNMLYDIKLTRTR